MSIIWTIVFVGLAGPTTTAAEPVLPRGMGYRIAGEAQTPRQLLEDVYYVQRAIAESGLDKAVQKALSTAVDDAAEKLKVLAKIEPADEVGRKKALDVREELDREAGRLLSAADRKLLRDRTLVLFSEMFLLTNGVNPEDFEGEVGKALKLTVEQKRALVKGIEQMEAALGALKDPNPSARADLLNRFRIRFRNVLTDTQRRQWDQIVLEALAKAAEENKKK